MTRPPSSESLQPPEVIRRSGIVGAPIGFDWNTDVSDEVLYPPDGGTGHLFDGIASLAPEAVFPFALAVGEWSVWRFDGVIDVSDAVRRIALGYAAIADPTIAPPGPPAEPFPETQQDAHGPLLLARMLINDAHEAHVRGDSAVYAVALSLCLLSLHVCANDETLVGWLESTLRRDRAAHPVEETAGGSMPMTDRRFLFDGDEEQGNRTA